MAKIRQVIELEGPTKFSDFLDEYWDFFQIITASDTRDKTWSKKHVKIKRYDTTSYGMVMPREGYSVKNPQMLYGLRWNLVQDDEKWCNIIPISAMNYFKPSGIEEDEFMSEYKTYLTYARKGCVTLDKMMSLQAVSFGLVNSENLPFYDYWFMTHDHEKIEVHNLERLGATSDWSQMYVPTSI